MSEENKEEVKAPSKEEMLNSVLDNLVDGPDLAQIDQWKVKHGDVFMFGFSDTDVYFFKSLSRKEYKKQQIEQQTFQQVYAMKVEGLRKTAEDNNKTLSDDEIKSLVDEELNHTFNLDDNVVKSCVLWPVIDDAFLDKKAGTVPVLVEQIMQNSNFMSPQQAVNFVFKL